MPISTVLPRHTLADTLSTLAGGSSSGGRGGAPYQPSILPLRIPAARSIFRRFCLRASIQTMAAMLIPTTISTAHSQVISIEKIASIGHSSELFWTVGQLVLLGSLVGFVIVLAALLVFHVYIAPRVKGGE